MPQPSELVAAPVPPGPAARNPPALGATLRDWPHLVDWIRHLRVAHARRAAVGALGSEALVAVGGHPVRSRHDADDPHTLPGGARARGRSAGQVSRPADSAGVSPSREGVEGVVPGLQGRSFSTFDPGWPSRMPWQGGRGSCGGSAEE